MKGAFLTLLFHAFATWLMIGMIFFVQVVYYPLYKRLKKHLTTFEKKDLIHMGYLVGPTLMIELVSGVVVLFALDKSITYRILAYINVTLLVSVWIVSIIIKCRHRSSKKTLMFLRFHHMLLTSNWIRTTIWGIRGVVVLFMVYYSIL